MSTAAIVSETRNSGVRPHRFKKAFSFPVLLCAFLVMLAVLSARSRFNDPDMWWQLKMGQIIWTTHSIPLTDQFSFTTNHQASIPHEWLSQLTIYSAFRFAGYSGLMLWLCSLSAAILVAGYVLCRLYTGNPKISFLGALVIWFFATVGTAVRPQMVGYLLLSLELLLIQLGTTRSPRWFLGLPLLFIVWVNAHGSFLMGLCVAGIFLLESFTPFQAGLVISPRWSRGVRNTFLLALIISALALLCNPVGLKQVLYPLNTLVHQPLGLSQVEEWQPLALLGTRGLALMAILLCIVSVVIVRRTPLFWHEILLLAFGTWMALSHGRLIFVFGILASPALCRLLSDFWDGYGPAQDHPVPNAVLLTAAVVVTFLAFPGSANLANQVAEANPVNAVAYIKANHLSGHMLNEYVYGGYLIWADPENPVFIDGRADVFEWTGVFDQFSRWEGLQSDPRLLLDQYGIQFCLLARNSPMVTVLSLLKEWKIEYQDDRSIIFTRTASSASLRIDAPGGNSTLNAALR